MRPFAVVLVAAGLLVGGCGTVVNIGGERGSGTIESETREVSGFDSVVVFGSGEITIEVSGSESLVVEADDNILPLLTTEVRNGRLELGAREPISPSQPVRYTITAASLDGVTIEGSGDVIASGIGADRFGAEISGSGDISATGSAAELEVSISGSGSVDAEGLVATTGEVDIAGSGNAVINVTDVLDVSIAGSGNVEYIGNPAVDSSVAGSGSVSQR